MPKIKDVSAYEIIDSRGNPALAVSVQLQDDTIAGASSATNVFPTAYGVVDIKDNDPKRYQGNGLTQSISIIENIVKPKIIGMECTEQQAIDKLLLSLDTIQNKNKIGGNTLITLSMAIARASAISKKEPLFYYLQKLITASESKIPVPIFTMIDGGKNANYITEIHEFLFVPATFKSYRESLELGVIAHNQVEQILLKENILPFVGEKGGFGPLLSSNEDAISLVAQVFETMNIRLGYDAYIGIDANANAFNKDEHYKIKDKNVAQTAEELIKFYSEMCEQYHILYMEDPLADDDIEGWIKIYAALNKSVIIAGDYFTATNPYRLQMAVEKKTINSIVIKPANIGTVTEALAVSVMAKAAGLKIIVSDRTAETNDTFLADFAAAISADYVRFGAPVRGERTAKYNRLLSIEREINNYK